MTPVREYILSKLELVLKRIQKPEEPKHQPAPPETSTKLMMVLNRLSIRKWLPQVEEEIMLQIRRLRYDVKWIEHLPHCRRCRIEVEIDVERYLGSHIAWFVDLQSGEYWEKSDPSCPKEKNYKIDNYWAQVKRYRETGTTDWKESETMKFILDRAKWAYKIEGKQIHVARQKLKLVRNWDFSERCERQFTKLENTFLLFSSGVKYCAVLNNTVG